MHGRVNGESGELVRETSRRKSTFYDADKVLFDREYWTENFETVKEAIEKALMHQPRFDEFIYKKERVVAVLEGN